MDGGGENVSCWAPDSVCRAVSHPTLIGASRLFQQVLRVADAVAGAASEAVRAWGGRQITGHVV